MKILLVRFWCWLWPSHYSEIAACVSCGACVSKTRMVHDKAYGYFCNEDEASDYMDGVQW
jgi:hypothetical protein